MVLPRAMSDLEFEQLINDMSGSNDPAPLLMRARAADRSIDLTNRHHVRAQLQRILFDEMQTTIAHFTTSGYHTLEDVQAFNPDTYYAIIQYSVFQLLRHMQRESGYYVLVSPRGEFLQLTPDAPIIREVFRENTASIQNMMQVHEQLQHLTKAELDFTERRLIASSHRALVSDVTLQATGKKELLDQIFNRCVVMRASMEQQIMNIASQSHHDAPGINFRNLFAQV